MSIATTMSKDLMGPSEHRKRRTGLVSLAMALGLLLGAPASNAEGVAKAAFAGGCFWCMQPAFDAVDGVLSTRVGYTGGSKVNPSYQEVSAGGTGHAEAIEISFDPGKVSYDRLLEVFWHNIDPLTANGQFCDHGSQYRSAIFVHDDEQRRLAEAAKRRLAESGRFNAPIVTEIVTAGPFYPAEDYHQKYAEKNPYRYKYYRYSCGRDRRLRELWGSDAGGH
jgi:peptide-methionine (S)-S-oxide reductase